MNRRPDNELGQVKADLVVLTALPEEYAAVRACLREPAQIPGGAAASNANAWQLGTVDSSQYPASFKVVLGISTPTNSYSALAASKAIELFDPQFVVFVGVAGGFDLDGQRLGDVAVSSTVCSYEYGKLDTGGFKPRPNFTYRCNEALVRATEAARGIGEEWWRSNKKEKYPPRVRTGIIASGDKIVDDPDEAFFAAVSATWPKLLAVEMEGAGVATAVHEVQGHHSVGFLLVRGISDMPHRKVRGAPPSTQTRDRWKVPACQNAARFLAYLIASQWPIPPRAGRIVKATSSVPVASNVSGSSVEQLRPATLTPDYPSAESQALSERLQDAWGRKERLRGAGLATEDVDREILRLRRELREGGQLRSGDVLGDGRYLLIKPLGRGGFAVVWEAHDKVENRLVAIKVLHQHLATDLLRRERFFRGARVMMELEHPAIVRVYDPQGIDESFCYFVMELLRGGNLRESVLGQRIEASHCLRLLMTVAGALAEAHRKQLVHRDVNPTNILLNEQGNAKLTDFDLVGAHDTTGGTRTGALGTFVYAAPECLDRPQDATARADVFSLGMTAVFCLSGRALSMAVFRNPAKAVALLDCSSSVRSVIERAVDWDPENRYQDAGAMLDALETASIDSPPTAADGHTELRPTIFTTVQTVSSESMEPGPSRVPRSDDADVIAYSPPTRETCLVQLYPPGPDLGRRTPLLNPHYIVGRDNDAGVVVGRNSVSRQHARLYSDDDGTWWVEDLDSTNGTFVNESRIRAHTLADGDQLRFGDAIYKFLSGSNIESAYHEAIHNMAIQDGMTGIHNQRYFVEFLEREIEVCSRRDHPLTLIKLDIDHFRKVNDTHGHLAGDVVLKNLAERIRPSIRPQDLFARYGGDEFACVLPSTSLANGIGVAENLRLLIEQPLCVFDGVSIPYTISLGVSALNQQTGVNAALLIKRADENLFNAKQSGRNRVVPFPP